MTKDLINIPILAGRIYMLLERYLDAMETNLATKDYSFAQRELDARVFSQLSRTLTKLTQLNQTIHNDDPKQNNDIKTRLEQRLAQLVKRSPNEKICEESQ